MFLLIGDAGDACGARVQRALCDRGHDVVRTSTPIAAPYALSWRIDRNTAARMAWSVERTAPAPIAGVLVRPSARPVDPDGWEAGDLEYVQHETHAALLAWLWTLDCPVINRPRADLFYRPYRSYPEWHQVFATCGLPAAPIRITNAREEALAFGARYGGRATYAPLTSTRRYPLASPHQWEELAKLTAHVPVCLLPATAAPSLYATVVGDSVVWDRHAPLDARRMDAGLIRLAAWLGLDFVQVEIAGGEEPHCLMVDPYPLLERHDRAAQAAVVDRLVERLAPTARRREARQSARCEIDGEPGR